MTKSIDISVRRNGFPVKLSNPDTGESIELWFDSSIESLQRFVNVDESAKERLENIKEYAEKFSGQEEAEATAEDVEAAINFNKAVWAAKFDLMFGEGTFEKVYDFLPDYEALEQAYLAIDEAIAQKLVDEENRRMEEAEQFKKQISEKQKQKSR
ncbi:hypothetical protein [Enterococcus faecium]|uniref:hypothetical protein n=1 Tax=Enterococcus faecium TaxID=1352 RepID=UPI000F512C4A|nr:hypothetical protein [Enterococcus faecium]ROY16667.1 hypothetical protein EGW55_03910 [Enterococcus faecium]HAR1751239.1 hypothetical protein [Enterococcus faecium]